MTRTPPRIVGNYALGAPLGRGATSEVHAGEHRVFGDAIAIKLLRPELAVDDAIAGAFIEEAVCTRELDHPAIVRVLDAGRDPATGACYLVMERIDGESLASRLTREGRIAEPELRALGAALAEGLHAAHARGVVHRDVKPGNVMLRGPTAPVIVDFGIAKSLGAGSAAQTARRIGTLAYMAPEQLADGLITPAIDIWALGVVLFEAATGRLPFASFDDGRIPQLVEAAPRAASLAPISPELDALIAACLERSPGRRPPSMATIAAVLRGEAGERVTEDLGAIPASPRAIAPPLAPAPLLAPAPPRPRRRWAVPVGAAVAVVAGTTLALAIASSEDPPVDAATLPLAAAAGGGEGSNESTVGSAEPGPTGSADGAGGGEGSYGIAAGSAEPGPTGSARGDGKRAPAEIEARRTTGTGSAGGERGSAPVGIAAGSAETGSVGSAGGATRPADDRVEVVVRSTPSGSAVLVDGRRHGVTPARLRVRVPARIVVRRAGYRTARVVARRAGELAVRLRRLPRPKLERGPHRETLD